MRNQGEKRGKKKSFDAEEKSKAFAGDMRVISETCRPGKKN